jgi:hypothetical protein
LASREEASALIIQEKEVEDFKDLWPDVKSGIIENRFEKKAVSSVNRRWIFAAAGIAALFMAGILFVISLSQNGIPIDQNGEVKFKINSIRVGGEVATPFLYQPKDSDIILVWAEKDM